jgi:bisphosphoglycerate-independent phosphoglycerate mutase (AlkP superfamily)
MNELIKLQNAIAMFNAEFDTNLHAELFVYTECVKVELHYNDSKDSVLFFNFINDAIANINQTYNIWMDAK